MNAEFDLTDKYINRELSWINFNSRVLSLALDKHTPLLEQAKFSAIFSNNLDEFFMVRVASLKAQIEAGINKKSVDGKTPTEQLKAIRELLIPLLASQQKHFQCHLLKEMSNNGINILNYSQLEKTQVDWVNSYFYNSIFPILTPLAVDDTHPFPFISNLSINLAVEIKDPASHKVQFARIKVPLKTFDRFIAIPEKLDSKKSGQFFTYISIEEIIAANMHLLFPGMKIQNYYTFRVTRDADLELRDIEADDLMIAIEEGLRKRRVGGEVVRLEISSNTPKEIINKLTMGMGVDRQNVYLVNGILGLDDLFSLNKIPIDKLKYDFHSGKTPELLKQSLLTNDEINNSEKNNFKSIFSIIKNQDLLLLHPYDLFDTSVEEFLRQASIDKKVKGIKITLYRTSKDSKIIDYLINAAENGKQVMALVELKARFDEDQNIQWAKQLEQSGVHVVYGVAGLKTHTKVTLIIRQEDSEMKSYVHIGTGNYNCKTSANYTDIGLLSAKPELGQDLIELFNFLTGFSKQQNFRHILVAPTSLREKLEYLINREIKNVISGKKGHIKAKMNSLVDPTIIKLLYKASQAGVKIELIIRGMCCLYPKLPGISENIRVISIIGRFLEHSRIFWFANDDEPEAFIGSADWMRRNLDRRVEAVTPIKEPLLRKKLERLLNLYLQDRRGAWEMNRNGEYIKLKPETNEQASQEELITLWNAEMPHQY